MERMGHSSLAVTLGTYGHLLPGLEADLTARIDEAITTAQGDHYCPYVARPITTISSHPKNTPPDLP